MNVLFVIIAALFLGLFPVDAVVSELVAPARAKHGSKIAVSVVVHSHIMNYDDFVIAWGFRDNTKSCQTDGCLGQFLGTNAPGGLGNHTFHVRVPDTPGTGTFIAAVPFGVGINEAVSFNYLNSPMTIY